MIYNGVTEYLRRRFVEMRQMCYERNLQERADTGRSLLFIKRYFYDEMVYKILFLVDQEFSDFGEYLDAVRALIPLRKSYVLRTERGPEELELLRETEQECLRYVDHLKETDTAQEEGYCRVLFGQEREELEYAILEKWGYCAEYWYPLKGGVDESKLFLRVEYIEPYWDRLCALLGLPGERVYEYGESYYEDGELSEVDQIECYGGNEYAYLPKDLSWIVYFSHEETVTFAGRILPEVKALLEGERAHWNLWE